MSVFLTVLAVIGGLVVLWGLSIATAFLYWVCKFLRGGDG